MPPAVPLRKANSRTPSGSPNQSRPTSFTSSGEVIDDGPRPPPRVASVRGLGMGKSKSIQLHGSKESLDRAETNSPAVSPSHQVCSTSTTNYNTSDNVVLFDYNCLFCLLF